ncbi:hypothetical protein GDO78_002793 [Eleutherodactylus coqui]|uniref:Uncharacterized protein n=1 Tax=Eleutherodactylus coqui TaxID=57060 RepID=A0A8J6K6V6_ELECQ|nr:hypothetical protein GDO78_002793 [Eleutherodactylus coqui]
MTQTGYKSSKTGNIQLYGLNCNVNKEYPPSAPCCGTLGYTIPQKEKTLTNIRAVKPRSAHFRAASDQSESAARSNTIFFCIKWYMLDRSPKCDVKSPPGASWKVMIRTDERPHVVISDIVI